MDLFEDLGVLYITYPEPRTAADDDLAVGEQPDWVRACGPRRRSDPRVLVTELPITGFPHTLLLHPANNHAVYAVRDGRVHGYHQVAVVGVTRTVDGKIVLGQRTNRPGAGALDLVPKGSVAPFARPLFSSYRSEKLQELGVNGSSPLLIGHQIIRQCGLDSIQFIFVDAVPYHSLELEELHERALRAYRNALVATGSRDLAKARVAAAFPNVDAAEHQRLVFFPDEARSICDLVRADRPAVDDGAQRLPLHESARQPLFCYLDHLGAGG